MCCKTKPNQTTPHRALHCTVCVSIEIWDLAIFSLVMRNVGISSNGYQWTFYDFYVFFFGKKPELKQHKLWFETVWMRWKCCHFVRFRKCISNIVWAKPIFQYAWKKSKGKTFFFYLWRVFVCIDRRAPHGNPLNRIHKCWVKICFSNR